jgi:hypothetical protein
MLKAGCAALSRYRLFPRSKAELGNDLYNRQAKLGKHFRSQVQLGNELKKLSSAMAGCGGWHLPDDSGDRQFHREGVVSQMFMYREQRDAHSYPRRGWRVSKGVAAKCLTLPAANAGLQAEGGMGFTFPPYDCFKGGNLSGLTR